MIAYANYGHYHVSRVHSLSLRYYWYLKCKWKRFFNLKKKMLILFSMFLLWPLLREQSPSQLSGPVRRLWGIRITWLVRDSGEKAACWLGGSFIFSNSFCLFFVFFLPLNFHRLQGSGQHKWFRWSGPQRSSSGICEEMKDKKRAEKIQLSWAAGI